jgi:two-component system LytT family response regulator
MTDPLKVVIADDEPLARAGLESLVRADRALVLVAACADGREAAAAVRQLSPDLVLLDVSMPFVSGIDVVRALSADRGVARLPVVVFITAYDHFAVPAFDVHAVDYVLKPFDDDRYRLAIERAKRRARDSEAGVLNDQLLGVIKALSAEGGSPPPSQRALPLTRLLLRHDGRSLLLRVDDIEWIEAADYCVRIHVGGRVHVLRESMASLESQLDPQRFFRSHRSAIVNLDRVREIQPTFKGEYVIVTRDGSRITLARSKRAALEAVLGRGL